MFDINAIREQERLKRFQDDRQRKDDLHDLPIQLYLGLRELRAFWAFSSINESGNAIDMSGQARTLTNTGGTTRSMYNGVVTFADFNGTTQYYSRADEAGLDITSVLTLGGWFWVDSLTSFGRFMTKFLATGNQRAYSIFQGGSTNIAFSISVDGTAVTSVATSASSLTLGVWHFIVGRYNPSTSLDINLDGVWTTNTTSIPASIFNSTANFGIGAEPSAAANFLDGRAALCFLCADNLTDTPIKNLFTRTRTLFGV